MTGAELVKRFKSAIAADSRTAVEAAIDFMIADAHEKCAQIADNEARYWRPGTSEHGAFKDIAAAIRARGETT